MIPKNYCYGLLLCGLLLFAAGCQKEDDPRECSDCAQFTSFTLMAYNNPGLVADISGVIGADRTITLDLPPKTNVKTLIPNFIFEGKEVVSGGRPQVSGSSVVDLSQPVEYSVVAQNGRSEVYTVRAFVQPSSDHTLNTFILRKAHNPGLAGDVVFAINQQTGTVSGELFRWIEGDLSGGLVPWFETEGKRVSVAGKEVISGVTALDFKGEMVFRVTAETGATRDYRVSLLCPQVNATLPVMKIDADGPINSEEIYQTASLRIYGNGIGEGLWNSAETGKKIEIRLRGNSTAWLPKRPYRIKFPDKFSPLGLNHAKEKSWVLLANDADKTMLRNAVAFEASRIMLADHPRGAGFTASTVFTDVYIDGSYKGVYHLTDQIEVAPGRVPVESLKAKDGSDPAKIGGGYLLEIDGFASSEPLWFKTALKSIPVTIKYPKDDDYDAAQVAYISDLFGRQAEGALFSAGFTDPINGWRKYFDERSLADYVIISEMTGNSDAWWSTYVYKYRGDPLFYFGPVWDFDIAFNNDNRLGDARQKLMFIHGHIYKEWITRWLEDPAFKKTVKSRWNQKKGELAGLAGYVTRMAAAIDGSQKANFRVWDIREQTLGHAGNPPASYEAGITQLKGYLETRWQYLDGVFTSW